MSYAISIVDSKGKAKERKLSPAIFSDDNVNESLIHEYVVMYLANQRQSTAHTKTRGEVTRSGRKLFRQKGTGRARVGDAGSPIRRKWWVAFGPRNTKIWSKDMPKKMKRKALFGALTLKAKSETMKGLAKVAFDSPKTSEAVSLLNGSGVLDGRTLVVLDDNSDATLKSFRNIKKVDTVQVAMLNAYDVMSHKTVVFASNALDTFESMFTS